MSGAGTPRPEWDESLVSAYLDGELDASARAQVEVQLGASSEARDALDDVRFARDALRALPLRAVPDGFFERVTAAVAASDDGTMITNGPEVARAAVSDLAARRGHRRWYGIAAAAVAAALVIAVAVAPRDSQVHPNVATLSDAHAVQASVGNELVGHLAPAGVPARFEP
ncbi:MAG: hypothetical protein E6G60_02295 [Actinobacteria bacterium]|nr:MAG: hypothetical protein E6G60_02295 [Actinomycetota bacterium]